MRGSLRTLAIGVFVSLAIAFLAGAHYYLALRLVVDPGWPEPARSLGLALIALLAASLVAQPIAERAVRRPFALWVAWPASLWMGAAFWLLLLLLASDALLWLTGAAGVPPSRAAEWRAGLVLAATGAAVVAGLRGALSPPALRREEFAIER